jgi:hypothetical protein
MPVPLAQAYNVGVLAKQNSTHYNSEVCVRLLRSKRRQNFNAIYNKWRKEVIMKKQMNTMTTNKTRTPPPPRIPLGKFITITALILTLAAAAVSCGDGGSGGGAKSITITGIPDEKDTKEGDYAAIKLLKDRYDDVAVGGGNISGGTLTVDLKDSSNEEKDWNGSGSYYIFFYPMDNYDDFYYTNGKSLVELGISGFDADKLPKYNITQQNTTIPFDKFGALFYGDKSRNDNSLNGTWNHSNVFYLTILATGFQLKEGDSNEISSGTIKYSGGSGGVMKIIADGGEEFSSAYTLTGNKFNITYSTFDGAVGEWSKVP